MSTTVAFTRH